MNNIDTPPATVAVSQWRQGGNKKKEEPVDKYREAARQFIAAWESAANGWKGLTIASRDALIESFATALATTEAEAEQRLRAEIAEKVRALLTPYHGVPDPQVSAYEKAINKALAIIERSGK